MYLSSVYYFSEAGHVFDLHI